MSLNSQSSSLQLPNAGVTDMPHHFYVVLGIKHGPSSYMLGKHSAPWASAQEDPLKTIHVLDTSWAFNSRAIISFAVTNSCPSRSSFQKQKVLFPRNPTVRKVSLLLPASPSSWIPSTNGYWVPAPHQAPGRTPESQGCTSPCPLWFTVLGREQRCQWYN